MTFYPEDAPVPELWATEKVVLRPLSPQDAALDHAALLVSKEMLRLWSGSDWPADDFTVADNVNDLAWHWQEHQERLAFTYTVLNPAETLCLGCVYIKPISDIFADNVEVVTAVSPHSALVRFWITAPYLAQNLDSYLLNRLRQWFASAWRFPEVYWHTRLENSQQVTLFQAAGLKTVAPIFMPERGGKHLLFV